MSAEVFRLEFDDGPGVDFASPADALFHVAYGRDNQGLRGVTGLREVTHPDAEGRVVDGSPMLVHQDPEPGAIVWDRDALVALVRQAHESEDTPPAGALPDEATPDVVAQIAEDA